MRSTNLGTGNIDPSLVVYKTFPPGLPSFVQLRAEEPLSLQLMEHFPDRNGGMHFKLWRNSSSNYTEIDPPDAEKIIVRDGDVFVLQFHPAKNNILPLIGLAVASIIVGIVATPWTGAAMFAVGAAGMVAADLLMTVPKAPAPESQDNKASGSNYLDKPSNQMRNGSRVPEVFGRMRVWPDLIAPAYVEYDDGYDQTGVSYYCISEGLCEISNNKLDVTSIDGNSSYTIQIIRGAEAVLPRIKAKRPNVLANNVNLSRNQQSDWFDLPGERVEEIHWEVYFPKGLLQYRTGGGLQNEAIEIRVFWRAVYEDGRYGDSQNQVFTVSGTYENPWIKTLKVFVATGKYQAAIVKNTDGRPTSDNISVNDLQLSTVSGVEYIDNMPGLDRTYVRLQYKRNAVTNQTAILFNYNCIAQRYLYQVERGGTTLEDFVFDATSQAKDALAYTLYSVGTGAGVAFDQIDFDSLCDCADYLYGIDERMSEFNAILDMYSTVEDQLTTICSACRITISNHYGKFFFTVDQPQELPVALFNRRNRFADDESNLAINFRSGEEPDAFQIDWKDSADDYQPKTFTYPISEDVPVNPTKIEGTGLIYYDMVYRRARYEWDAMKNRRRTKTVKVTEEAQLLLPMSLVAVVEPWVEIKLDGEIIAVDADLKRVKLDKWLDTDALTGNETIRIRSLDGVETSPLIGFTVDADDTSYIVLDRMPAFEVSARTEPRNQMGNLYDIGVEDNHNRRLWLVTRGEITKTSVNLTLLEYAPEVYTFDSEDVPT